MAGVQLEEEPPRASRNLRRVKLVELVRGLSRDDKNSRCFVVELRGTQGSDGGLRSPIVDYSA